jgi:4-hydroxy-tetrahydrodipicolinate reductase
MNNINSTSTSSNSTNQAPIKIILFGATGRMGREIALAASRAGHQVIGGIVEEDNKEIGNIIDNIIHPLCSEWQEDIFKGAQVIIDFSSSEGTVRALEAAFQHKLPILVGTTGVPEMYDEFFKRVANVAPLIKASNTSIGMNVMFNLVKSATQLLGTDTDIEISEIHHNMKKDAPSGTALSLGEVVAEARNQSLSEVASYDRTKQKQERKKGEVGISAIRGGDVPGEHTVYYFRSGERIEITHRALNRTIFADGAVKAGVWLAKPNLAPGRYTMMDVIQGF